MVLIVFPQKKTTVVTLYQLHPESVPSDIMGILELFNWQSNAHQSANRAVENSNLFRKIAQNTTEKDISTTG